MPMSSDRIPRLLIPDTTPLSLLAMLGEPALDWVFVLQAEVWGTDMVRAELVREPDASDDPRRAQRGVLRTWFDANVHRIKIKSTQEGEDYEREMRNWLRGGRVPADKPSWRHRGERSMAEVLPAALDLTTAGHAVVILIDDRAGRALLVAAAQIATLDADIMGTETFISLLREDFNIAETRTAWQAIQIASHGTMPVATMLDPVYVRK